jgi:5-methylcytosine-specific restriction endonuclease McrA
MNTNPSLHSGAVIKLNACWQALSYITPKDAFTGMFNDLNDNPFKALDIVLEEDGSISGKTRAYDAAEWMKLPVRKGDVYIGLAHGKKVRVPHAVIATSYHKLPKIRLKFSKRGLYTRDRGKCVYCEKHLPYEEATKDHVIPVSKGGLTTWENCVLSCHPCNFKKANLLLPESGMSLRKKPAQPIQMPILLELRLGAPREHIALLNTD